MASHQLVIFGVNEESFGVEITQVKEIIRPMEIYKIPNTPDFIEGLINLRGKVHTIFNLRKKFNLPNRDFDDNTKIIIVGIDSLVVGFIVDEVSEIVRIEDEDIESTPRAIVSESREFLSGVAKMGDKIILLLDLNKALSIEEVEGAKKVSGAF